jgi:hypothetical protein
MDTAATKLRVLYCIFTLGLKYVDDGQPDDNETSTPAACPRGPGRFFSRFPLIPLAKSMLTDYPFHVIFLLSFVLRENIPEGETHT